jgi:hypothetical protein
MHQVWAPGGCQPARIATIDAPVGRLSISLHIKGWSATNKAGIPLWTGFQRWEPDHNMYTGWGAYLGNVAGPDLLHGVSSSRTPDNPAAGGVLDYTEQDNVVKPFRFQAEITGPTWYGGDGSCHQAAMESWLTITTVAGGNAGGNVGTPPTPPSGGGGVEDPVANVKWSFCVYPNPAEGCGIWEFMSDGRIVALSTSGAVQWTGAWTRLGHYTYRYQFQYMGRSNVTWVRFSDPQNTGHATLLYAYPTAAMTVPYRKGQPTR